MIEKIYADICQFLKLLSMKTLNEYKSLLNRLECFYREIPEEFFKVEYNENKLYYIILCTTKY